MSASLLALASAAATGTAALAAIEIRERRASQWRTLELRFGRDVDVEAVVAVLERFVGLSASARLVLDASADQSGIRHFVSGEQAVLDTVRGNLRALLPGVRLEAADDVRGSDRYTVGAVMRLTGRLGALRQDGAVEVAASLLASLQPVGRSERVLVRWYLRPGRAHGLPRAANGQLIEAEERRVLRHKNAGSVVGARCVVAVKAGHHRRAAHLLARTVAVLRSRGTPYGQLRPWHVSGRLLTWLLSRHSLISSRVAAAELVGPLGWPINAPVLEGLRLGTSPQLLPSDRIPSSHRVLGTATWPGSERPIAQPLLGALSHTLVAGPTGTGKSTLVTNLIAADLSAGLGAVVIDGKGDTATTVLARIPAARRDDVIVLDCGADGPLPGLRLFGSNQPELAADVVLGVLADLWRDSWGPLSERYLRAGLMAIARDSDSTLADLPYVFTDAAYRRRLVGNLRDPLSLATFAGFEAMTVGERNQQLAAPLGKLGQLLGRPSVRTVLGQTTPQLDFGRVLRERKIVVVSLAPSRIGAPAARLVGALVVFALFQAVQARSSLSETARRPFLVYVDEPKALGDLPMPLDVLLEQARGLGVGVCLSPQSISQLPRPVRDAAMTNVASRIAFRQDNDDARLLARDLAGVTAEDLGDLGQFEAVARIGLGPGDIAPPVTIRTHRPSRPTSDPLALRVASAARYGRTVDEVDAGLLDRHTSPTSAPVGRKRRVS